MSQLPRDTDTARTGRRIALLIAGVALFWMAANVAGAMLGWTIRTQGLFDLIALAGFAVAFWMIFRLWQRRGR